MSTKEQAAQALAQLKLAKAAHMEAWKASQEATKAYNAVKAEYWALCQELEQAKAAA